MGCIITIIMGAIAGWLGSDANDGATLFWCKITAGITGAFSVYRLFVQPAMHIDNVVIRYLVSGAIGGIVMVEITNLFKKRIHSGLRYLTLALIYCCKKLNNKGTAVPEI